MMQLQTKQQKNAEQIYRGKVLGQRLNKYIFDPKYKYGNRNYYIKKWVSPQISQFKKIINKMGVNRIENKNILELGAESGHISTFIYNNFRTKVVIASDIAYSLKEAMPNIASWLGFNKYPKVVILDNYYLPFKDDSFDFIFGFSLLHHFPDPYIILKEIKRVLKKDGVAVFSGEPFLPRYLLPLQFLYSRFDKKQGICESVFSLRQWFSFLKDFRILRLEFEVPAILKWIVPNIPFICKSLTGGGVRFVFEKK